MDSSLAMGFWWHKQPADGFYCIYRKRSTENVSSCGLPDCPNITGTLRRHADMLTSVGVDFIVADSTNIQSTGAAADALQLRPWEVVGEEWLALRKQGIPTPKIAIWQNLGDAAGNLWESYVNGAYSDPQYEDLIFKDKKTGKKVMFTTANPTKALVDKIEAKGEIVVVVMWAERYNFDQGEWGFFSPCTAAPLHHDFTSSVFSSPSKPCRQHLTTGSKIGEHGTSLTVGPSYQLSYSSLPFRASGKLGGLTLKKQFERAFEENAKGTLDYLQVGTFNEHVAQPQHNPYFSAQNRTWVHSEGLGADTSGTSLWVDMYGDGVTRDLEPTKEDGGRLWSLFESCMRIFHTGAAACTNHSEPCCLLDAPETSWVNVWSLTNGNGEGVGPSTADHLLTVDENERETLVSEGWAEVCSPQGGATAFCKFKTGMAPTARAYATGPFVAYAGDSSRGVRADASNEAAGYIGEASEKRSPLHRCIAHGGSHFISGA